MQSNVDAASLAQRIVPALPRRTMFRRFGGFRVPDRITDASDELCPKCGRRLVCSLGPLGGGGEGDMMIPRSRPELLGACLVDGARRGHAHDLPPDSIVAAARTIADGLAQRGWRPWAQAIEGALAHAWAWWPPVEAAGQALEALRAFGPLASELNQSSATIDAQAALEALVTSSGPYWLDCRTLQQHRAVT